MKFGVPVDNLQNVFGWPIKAGKSKSFAPIWEIAKAESCSFKDRSMLNLAVYS